MPKKTWYTYKDFVTGKTRRTSGRFVGWSDRTGPLNVRYATFRTPCTYVDIPAYCLTQATKAAIPPMPADKPDQAHYVCTRCNCEMIDCPGFLVHQTEAHKALTADAQSHSLDITYGLCGLCAQAVARPRFTVKRIPSPSDWEDTTTAYRVIAT